MASAAAPALAQDEAFARIRLLRSPNIGPVSFHQLLRRFGSAVAALEALPELAAKGKRQYRAAPVSRIEDEVAAVRKAGARYLFHDMADYPALPGGSMAQHMKARSAQPLAVRLASSPAGSTSPIPRSTKSCRNAWPAKAC